MTTSTKPTVPAVQVEKIDAEEAAGSVTGYDEIAIAKAFGLDLVDMQEQKKGTLTMRALLFITRRREGLSDKDAYRSVMEMRLSDVLDAFDTDAAEADAAADELDDEPVSAAGKGAA